MPTDSSDVLARVVQLNPGIRGINLVRFKVLPRGDERAVMDDVSKTVVSEARSLHDSLQLPFWDAAMCMTFQATGMTPGLFAAAAYHNRPLQPPLQIERDDLTADRIREETSEIPDAEILAALSRVEMLDGAVCHIPMLDFHAPASELSQASVCGVLQSLALRGFVLASGRSYHFIGIDLLTGDTFARFLGSALLFAPIIDRTWLAHQLIEGACALRVSPRREYGAAPRLVETIGVKPAS